MPRRLAIALALAVSAPVACSPVAEGPGAPLAREQLPAAPAFEASASRQVVMRFLEAYASSATDVRPLVDLVAGEELTTWVRWLDVQHREFDGTIEASADVRDVEFVERFDAGRTGGAQVGISATVTFLFDPAGEEAFQRARILDGLVTLVRTAEGFRVLDLVRDGVPMTDSIELFRGETRSQGGVTVTLDSLFTFTPSWQFNVEVTNASGRPLVAAPDATGLFVGSGAESELVAGAVTGSVLAVPPGVRVDGIVAAPTQPATAGRTLVLSYLSGERLLHFEFPLQDLVSSVPTGTGPTGPTAPTGPTGPTAATGPTGPTASTA